MLLLVYGLLIYRETPDLTHKTLKVFPFMKIKAKTHIAKINNLQMVFLSY
ncbi:hypothetical protein SPBRAN_2091 [uncultured Candidatus Thioglobus sp.]|nr:hypothetical protein SPBRAN_2091 [uncultured Candidatus Thioglobus sp.]